MSIQNELPLEEYCTEHRCTCAPPPKRRRIRRVGILDVLNVDLCRNSIFDYVSLGNLLRSEQVCQQWRNAVQHYLRGTNRIRPKLHVTAPWHPPPPRLPRGCRPLPLDESRDPWFSSALYKWGMMIEAVPCTAESFEEIVENCPNIREITFYGFPDRDLVKASVSGRLRNLTHVTFRNLCSEEGDREQVTDEDVSILLQSNPIAELTIIGNDQITGTFFQHLKKNNLKSLRLRNCPTLDYRHVLSVLEYLKEITTLELSRNSPDILKNVHLLLDVMPKLENLELCGYDKMELDGKLKTHVRLRKLKNLNLRRNKNVDDNWLDNIAKGNKLVTFDVSYCKDVTMTGLVQVCSSSRWMRELAAADNRSIFDKDVETLIRLCPNLTILNLQKCTGVTADLVVYLLRLPRGRRCWHLPALRLRLHGAFVPETLPMLMYSFILDFGKGTKLYPKPSRYLGF